MVRKYWGEPLKLGLDLRGGVHFLMEVDTETALSNRQNGTLLDIRRKLRDEKIRYNSIFVEKDQTIKLKVTDEAVFESATELLEDNYPQFVIGYTEVGDQFNFSL
ncbi:MAG: hypothetical protein Ct9H300mP20_06950 [Gammaproteobacteria bacterium]|nr:MAG: hypothetical protein Ct9H300mP20_06950 [Gammaproteobacteria bacterium]